MPAYISWIVTLAVLIGFALFSLVKLKNYRTAILAVAISLLTPFLWVGSECAASRTSEACVWGQSFMPLYIGLALLVGVPVVYLLITIATFMFLDIRKIVVSKSEPK